MVGYDISRTARRRRVVDSLRYATHTGLCELLSDRRLCVSIFNNEKRFAPKIPQGLCHVGRKPGRSKDKVEEGFGEGHDDNKNGLDKTRNCIE
jgi:hypothetical protein